MLIELVCSFCLVAFLNRKRWLVCSCFCLRAVVWFVTRVCVVVVVFVIACVRLFVFVL